MNKKERIIILLLALIAIGMILVSKFFPISLNQSAESSESENSASEAIGDWVLIIHRNDVVLRFDSGIDASYTVTGDVGKLTVEVKDNKWHVSEADCPNHVCKRMGWMPKTIFSQSNVFRMQ